MQTTYLDFERPLEELDKQVQALDQLDNRSARQQTALTALEERLRQREAEVCSALSPWQRVQLSRHPDRPYTLDYIEAYAPNSWSCTATGSLAMTRRLSAVWRVFAGRQ